jgi:hypothetical protein
MKITIVYESMFGNTDDVAQAISNGIRQEHPDAEVECVPVADASPELITSTDLLVVGGPTHIRGMTSGLSREMGISGEEKAEAKVETPHELEPDAEGPGLRDWFDDLPKTRDGGPAAAFDTRLGSPMAGGAAHGICPPAAEARLPAGRRPRRIHCGRRVRAAARWRARAGEAVGRPASAGDRPPIELNRLAARAVPAAGRRLAANAPPGA